MRDHGTGKYALSLLRVNQDESSASIKVRVGDREGGMVLGAEGDCKRG